VSCSHGAQRREQEAVYYMHGETLGEEYLPKSVDYGRQHGATKASKVPLTMSGDGKGAQVAHTQ